jgi:hypothetical protein
VCPPSASLSRISAQGVIVEVIVGLLGLAICSAIGSLSVIDFSSPFSRFLGRCGFGLLVTQEPALLINEPYLLAFPASTVPNLTIGVTGPQAQ